MAQLKLREQVSFAPPNPKPVEDVVSPHVVAEESTSEVKVHVAPDHQQRVASESNNSASPNKLTSGGVGSTDSNGFYFVQPKEGERNFYQIGLGTGTDKVTAPGRLPGCLKNDASCTRVVCGQSAILGGIIMTPYINRDWDLTHVMIQIHFSSSRLASFMVLDTTRIGSFFPMESAIPLRLLALKQDRERRGNGHGECHQIY